jgi:hypothetical protein
MKKVLFVLIMVMSVMAVSGQTGKTSGTKAKATHTTVKVTDLQKSITDNIAKDYAGFTIKEASSVTANNVETYHVIITKGGTTETLVYDKNGTFVKKLGKPIAQHHTSKKK